MTSLRVTHFTVGILRKILQLSSATTTLMNNVAWWSHDRMGYHRALPAYHIQIYTLNYPQITVLFCSRYQANPAFVATTTPLESRFDFTGLILSVWYHRRMWVSAGYWRDQQCHNHPLYAPLSQRHGLQASKLDFTGCVTFKLFVLAHSICRVAFTVLGHVRLRPQRGLHARLCLEYGFNAAGSYTALPAV